VGLFSIHAGTTPFLSYFGDVGLFLKTVAALPWL